ncbi:MAG: DUF2167 domain-containing protein [Rhizobacter sp.]
MRAAGALCLWMACAMAQAADMSPDERRAAVSALPWVKGPSDVGVGGKAQLKLAEGQGFLAEKDSGRFLELTGNLPSPGESILVARGWWAVFDFADVGYIKDDEKLDADELLKQLKGNDAPANEERRKRGFPEMHTDGWAVPPHYDSDTKHLEWGLKLRSADSPEPVINYTVRLLGRTGYENVVLVTGADTLAGDINELKATLKSFDFNSGEKYAEFKQGDRVAQFGLAALVVGGAAAALVKTGFWKTILVALAASWKLIAGVVVAALAGIGKLFGRNKTS